MICCWMKFALFLVFLFVRISHGLEEEVLSSLLAHDENIPNLIDDYETGKHSNDIISENIPQNYSFESLIKIFSHRWMQNVVSLDEEASGGYSFTLRRSLAENDFDDLNSLVQEATIILPDAEISKKIAGTRLKIKIRNLRCTNFFIGDIKITYTKNSNQRLTFQVDVSGLDIDCFMDYRYDYGFIDGKGSASAELRDNSASVALAFTSTNFDNAPPSATEVLSCNTDINVNDMDFKGGFIGWLLDQFDALISNIVEDELKDIACEELRSLSTTMVQDFLKFAGELISQYLGGMNDQDPLASEKNLSPPGDVKLLSFKDTENIIGRWFDDILKEAGNYFGNQQNDPDGPSNNGKDLGVNVALRDLLLEDDGSLTIQVEKLLPDGAILFKGHDKLTETMMILREVKFFGLDTLTTFNPLQSIGNYTLQNELVWRYLTIELIVDINIKPSTLPDSVISNPVNTEVNERIRIDFGVDNVDAVVTIMGAIDQGVIGQLPLGSILHTENIFSCLLSTFYDLELAQLSVEIGNVRDPTLTGFISPGIDRVVKSSVEAMFLMYEKLLLKAGPKFFGTKVRDIVNNGFINDYMSDPNNLVCPDESSDVTGATDLRDLLLKPALAFLSGGTGEEQYGNLASTVFELVEDQLKATESDGLPAINSVLVRSATKAQSGVEGMLNFPSTLVDVVKDDVESNVWASFAESIQLKLYNTSIWNLDTINTPLSLMQPSTVPHLLTNLFTLGPVEGRPFAASIKLLLSLDGEGSPLNMRNDIRFTTSVPQSYLSANILSKIDAKALMKFPLEDLTNYHCLLSTMAAPLLDDAGNRVDPNEDSNLALETFFLTLSELSFGVSCDDCTSPGVAALPDILDILEETGIMTIFRDRVQSFAKELLEGDWLQLILDRFLSEAPKMCPHHELYEEGAIVKDYGVPEISGLSRESVEGWVAAAVMALETTLVVIANGLIMDPVKATNALSSQNELIPDISEDMNFVNWRDLEGSVGAWADILIKELQRFLSAPSKDANTGEEDLGINILFRDALVGNDGIHELTFDDLSFKFAGVTVALTEIKFIGLDSVLNVDAILAIAPQTLLNSLLWQNVGIEVIASIDLGPNEAKEEIALSFEMKDVEVNFAAFVALDLDIIGNMEISSLLFTENIAPCVLSALYDANVPTLSVDIGTLSDPEIKGFVSGDVQQRIEASVKEIFDSYRPIILEAIPRFFDSTVREIFNGWLKRYTNQDSDSICPTRLAPTGESYLDFRDLFLPPDEAASQGGNGTMPYGDLTYLLTKLVNERVLATDPRTNTSKINDVIIKPITKSQSGTEGAVYFSDDLVTFSSNNLATVGLNSTVFRLFGARITNLDTIGDQLEVLKPNSTERSLVDNQVLMGSHSNPLRGSMSVLFEVSGDPVLNVRDEFDLSVEMIDANLFAVLLAEVETSDFFSYKLREILNYNCWLATMPTPVLDDKGVRVYGSSPSLALHYLAIAMDQLRFNLTCSSCTSTGLQSFPDIASSLEDAGILDELKSRLSTFSAEMLQSDFVQTFVDRMLVDAAKQCPQHPAYTESYTPTKYDTPNLGLSLEAFDSIVYSTVVLTEITAVVVAQTYSTYNASTGDESLPGSFENTSGESTEATLLDLTALSDIVGDWIDTVIEEVDAYLGGVVDDPTGPNSDTTGTDLGVNVQLRSLVLNESRMLVIALEDLGIGSKGTGITFKEARVIGLDSFSEFRLLDQLRAQTVNSVLNLTGIRMEVDVSVENILSSPAGRLLQEPQQTTISFEIEDLSVLSELFLAIDRNLLGSIQLGSIFNLEQILSCVLSSARTVEFTDILVNIGIIKEISVDGVVSEAITGKISDATNAILDKYESILIESIPTIFNVTIRRLLNNYLKYYLNRDTSVACPVVTGTSKTFGSVDLRDLLLSASMSKNLGGTGLSQYGNLIRTVFDYFNEEILKVNSIDGTSEINRLLIGPITEAQSGLKGTLAYPGDLFKQETRVSVGGLKANIEIKASNFRIENLDSIGRPIRLLQPITGDPATLENIATFGTSSEPLRLSVRVLIALLGDDDMQLRNEVDISLDLNTATVLLTTLLQISEKSLLTFPLRDALNLDCWLATMQPPKLDSRGVRVVDSEPSAALTNLAFAIAKVGLNITCVTCTSPEIDDLAALLSSPEGINDATEVANKLLDYATRLLGGEFLQVKIDRMLNEAAKKCPHSQSYDENSVEAKYAPFESPDRRDDSIQFLIVIAIVSGCIVLATILLTSTVKCLVRRRNHAWLKTLPRSEIFSLHQEQVEEAEQNARTQSMFTSTDIPTYVRYLVPVVLVANIGFFLSGHLSLGATVNIEAQFAGEAFTVSNFFEFSMAQSTLDIWNAGGKELAVLILIFSGIWPYTKQLITLVVWFLPPRVCSTTTRGNIFHWLDKLAKWSMVDIFVLVISIAAFRVSIGSPNVAFLTEDFYSVDLMVVPTWGLYANMIAQLLSQVSSHFIIHYHRLIVKAATRESPSDDDDVSEISDPEKMSTAPNHDMQEVEESDEQDVSREKLREHAFVRPHRGDADKLQVRRGVNPAVAVCSLLVICLIIYGCSVPSFSLEVLGIIGVAVESGQGFDEAVTYHSVFSVVGLLLEEAKFLSTAGDSLGLGTLCTLFVLTILVVPVIQTVALVRQWFVPLTKKSRNRTSNIVEILQAWQYVEVYLIALIVSAWQIGPISEFMINSYCDGLDDTFAMLVFYGIIDKDDAQCFKVTASVESGTYVLAVGAVMLALLSTFVVKAVFQYNVDKKTTRTPVQENPKLTDEDEVASTIQKIHPIPLMFTDQFRWLLHRQGTFRMDELDGHICINQAFSQSKEDVTVMTTLSDSSPFAKRDPAGNSVGMLPAIEESQLEESKSSTGVSYSAQDEKQEERFYGVERSKSMEHMVDLEYLSHGSDRSLSTQGDFEAALDGAFGASSDLSNAESELGLPSNTSDGSAPLFLDSEEGQSSDEDFFDASC